MIYNIHYDVSAMAISLFGLLFIWTKKGLRNRQNKILLGLLATCFFAALFDITSSVGNSYIVHWSYGWRDFHNYSYLLLHNLMPYLVSCYIVALTGMNFGRKTNLILQRLNVIPVALSFLLLIANCFNRKIFYYDETGIYTHGEWFIALVVLAYFYIILCILLLFRYGKNVSVPRRRMAYLFLIATLLSVGAQLLLPTILLQLCVEALCLLGMVIVVDNEDEVLDAEAGCYNRRSFIYNFNLYQHNGTSFPIIIIKVRRLTDYVNTIGADRTSRIKRSISDFLQALTHNAECYYVENDTFVLIGNSRCDAKSLEDAVRKGFEKEWQLEDYQLKLEAQVYHATVPEDVRSIEEMVILIAPEKAEGTSDPASEESSNAVKRYKREKEIEAAIQRGLRHGDIEVFYQPIWNRDQNKITSCEALIRFQDEKLGYIPAGTVMQVVGEKGYGREMESYLLEKVCRFICEHPLAEMGLERINTNLSRELLLDSGLKDTIDEVVDRFGVRHEEIGFEFSGAPLIRDEEIVRRNLSLMQESGYVTIMDRFGAGFTDIMDLADFPVSCIKFDSTFLKKIINNRKAYIIMIYSIKMSIRLGFSTVAVGVEKEEEKDILTNLGCDNIQGYYFSEALSGEKFYRYCIGFNGE